MTENCGMEAWLDSHSEKGASVSAYAGGRVAGEPSSHTGSAALPSVSTRTDQDAGCSFCNGEKVRCDGIAGRIADLRGSRGSWDSVFIDCGTAIGTVECRATDGTIHGVDARFTGRNVYTASDISGVGSDDVYSVGGGKMGDGNAHSKDREFVNGDNVRCVRMEEYGYICDEIDSDRNENSEDSCDEVEPGSETLNTDVVVVAKGRGDDFAISLHVRRIRRHCSRATSFSTVSVANEWACVMTSQGTPSLIGSGASQAQASAVTVQFMNESLNESC